MRNVSVLFAAAAASALLACNMGQPTTYKIAIDGSQLNALPASCYVDNNAPGTTPGSIRSTAQNFRSETEWVIWDGNEGQEYLDLGGTNSFALGEAAPITVSGVIQGTEDTFTGQVQDIRLPDTNGFTFTRTRVITVTFEKRGTAPAGRVLLNSNFTCANCGDMMNTTGFRTCTAELTFDGRRVDVDRVAAHSN